MVKPWALGALGAFSILILALNLLARPGAGPASLGAVLFTFLGVAFPVILMLMGASRDRRAGRALRPILALLVLLVLCAAGMLVFRGRVEDTPAFLGLPPAAAFQIYGIFLAALPLTALGFAWAFKDFAPSRQDIERLRRLTRRGDET